MSPEGTEPAFSRENGAAGQLLPLDRMHAIEPLDDVCAEGNR